MKNLQLFGRDLRTREMPKNVTELSANKVLTENVLGKRKSMKEVSHTSSG